MAVADQPQAIQRFDARDFTHLSEDMKTAFDRDGILVLDGLVPGDMCNALKARTMEMVEGFNADDHSSVFSSVSEAHASDEYFMSSGHTTRFFFEEGAFDSAGALTKPKELALNKIGHAMHDIDPVYDRFSRQPAFKEIAEGLGHQSPLLLQTMYIFKQPHIGGEVKCHQDSTYLWTEPQTCLAFWVAIEDATLENGCLWGIPGGHKGHERPKERFKRSDENPNKGAHEMIDPSPFDESGKVALEAPKGTVLVFNGLFPHLSAANTSDKSRHAYTLHLIDGAAHYPDNNWLQRPADMPLKGF
ncbi:phytanoyl-CoA dioxygenase family protein [Kordiimonas sp. SCSIO 12610]|uniref:phytanoyl-CoA dioxygenase family protein n=1 Tax=Kordiimonas sp. SCSIO 12610 TaxID=2829597 RepID=UPI00210C13B8|nr:phytanoyl-CoA dioxygenase family protein [Kordiimonas sp. SCSIO 12610]UTW56301.1 phytanoyl-CoA dioxygenase family protein [Kordiimonas sp. SCSIO 12610]